MSNETTTSAAGQPLKWSDEQLVQEAEVIVVGKFGVLSVYKVLRGIRDTYEQDRARLEAQVQQLQQELAEARQCKGS